MKTALIIGCDGQDGTYLDEYLTKKRYAIIGVARERTRINGKFIKSVDILKPKEVLALIRRHKPQEIYYLAAVHHSSQEQRQDDEALFKRSFNVHVHGLIHVLDAVRQAAPKARIFYAASSHVFGTPAKRIQNEQTPLIPECIYGITKAAGLEVCQYYRREFGMFVSTGILYNHESPLRQEKFVSQKIVKAAMAIRQGRQTELVLGDLSATIDWGFAGDYVRAMHLILAHSTPDDFIVATGTTHTVRDFVSGVFKELGLNWKNYVREDQTLIHKTKRHLQGDCSKLKASTGWTPQTDFKGLISLMVTAGLKA